MKFFYKKVWSCYRLVGIITYDDDNDDDDLDGIFSFIQPIWAELEPRSRKTSPPTVTRRPDGDKILQLHSI